MAIGELGERFAQPCMRIDAGYLAVLDERDHRPVVAAFVGTGEQSVFPIERHLADILPMSGTTLSSGIDGIHLSSALCGASIPRTGRTAESPTLW